MLLGILIMLVASAAYNSAPIALRAGTRSLPDHSVPALLRAVLTSRAGILGLALSLGGWGLEVLALTLIPLTLARSLLATGLVLMLALAWRELHEAVRWQGILGVLAIVGGIAAIAAVSPSRSTTEPTALQWTAVLIVLAPPVLAPYVLRATRRSVGTITLAVSAGSAYAVSALCSKALANGLESGRVLVALVALTAAAICAILGFVGELGALRRGEAAAVAPVYRALQILTPIACAPLLFGERWPADAGARGLLAVGLAATIGGVMLVSHRHSPITRAAAEAIG
jgi:drug/metabolite transporter (DMT)-like permease